MTTTNSPTGRKKANKAYEALLSEYGPQGWWPVSSRKGCNPAKSGAHRGYHPGDYRLPNTEDGRFEVCAGAILTQSTSWTNVEKALANLKAAGLLSLAGILKTENRKLATLIHSSLYHNVKAKKLKEFCRFLKAGYGGRAEAMLSRPMPELREELLGVWGLGPETVDSMLLYALGMPSFVVDAYTKRIFARTGLTKPEAKYGELKRFFEDSLPRDPNVYNEFHALVVEHGKRHCRSRPVCAGCPLARMCESADQVLSRGAK
jgi:endonuclease-3 related protein